MPKIVVHYGDNSEPPAQNRPTAQQAANPQESQYFKNHCPNCRGGIEFSAHGVGEEVACPHCQRLITLRFPPDNQSGPTEQIDAYLQRSSFPKTRTELLFLKTFRFPTELDAIRQPEFWQEVLGDTSQSIVSRLVASGTLQKGNAEVPTLLESKSKDELKSLAKARGISQSGAKDVLAQRLFEADSNGMSELFRGKTYFVCTAKGQLVIEKFVESEKELRLNAETAAESALRKGRYEDACTIVADFEASQVFPRGVGIDWTRYDAARDIEILNEIAYSPRPHRPIPESVLTSLRISAGMMNLWGENNPLKWLTGLEQEFAREAHVMLSAAISRLRLRELKRAGIQQVKILGSCRDNACETCRKADGMTYAIQSAPELPHGRCTCEYGCGCIFIAAP